MINAELCMRFLRKYGYKTTQQGVQKILDAWKVNKAGLLEKFRQHPNWDEDNLAIVINDVELPKQFSNKPLTDFSRWMNVTIPKYEKTKATEDKSEIYYINKLDDIRSMIRYANKNNKKVEIDGEDVHDIQEKAQQEYDEFNERTANLFKLDEDDDKAFFITNEFKEKVDKVYDAIKYIANYCTDSNITAEQAEYINGYYNVNASENQKLSRVINKLCTAIGLNEYRETETTTNLEGEEITREVGYQNKFNIMAEGITSKTYKVHVVASLNPIDFWGMSLMHNIGSCQIIECYNIENRNKAYSGQFSGGTTTLMLDSSTIIFYTVIEDYKGNKYYLEDKMNRCMFSISEDGTVMIQHRNYPDGRDGGDSNKAKYYREIMQKIVADLWNHEENLWVIRKGTSEVRNWYYKSGLHYNDLDCCGDVNVSLLKYHFHDGTKINIGVADAICPVCGRKHRNQGNIMCYDCRDRYYSRENAILDIFETNPELDIITPPSYSDFDVTELTSFTKECEHCGRPIGDDEGIEIDGNWYCDDDCAENDGYHWIEEIDEYRHEDDDIHMDYDTDEWHLEENMYQDDYNNNWYYGDPEVTTEDGSHFHDVDNAISADYDTDENGYWYPTEEMLWSDNHSSFRHLDNCIEIDGDFYWDEEDAVNHGYRQLHDDSWADADDCFYDEYHGEYYLIENGISVDDRYFADEESANDAGYVKINDEWLRRDELHFDELTQTYFDDSLADVITEDGKYFYTEMSAITAGYRETENGWVQIESERESA